MFLSDVRAGKLVHRSGSCPHAGETFGALPCDDTSTVADGALVAATARSLFLRHGGWDCGAVGIASDDVVGFSFIGTSAAAGTVALARRGDSEVLRIPAGVAQARLD